jgi:NADH-quinone oxidoreductase subunit N
MDFAHSLRLILPEEILSVGGLVLLLAAAWAGDRASRAVSIAAVAVLVAAGAFAVPVLSSGAMGADTYAFFGQMRIDAFAAFAKLLIYAGAIATIIVAPQFFGRWNAMRAEFPILVVFAALGMGIMVSAGDLMTLYIGLEMNSLAAYVLASFLRVDGRSAEAGLKYFVLGALASGILLYGMSLTYGFTGTTSFVGIRAALSGELQTGALFGLIIVLAGLAFKISAVPFHMWTPDVFEGAPTPVTTFFSTAPKVAALALTMRVVLDAFGGQVDAWRQVVVFAALASVVVGALGGIGQDNIKRMLAYSSINHVGFMLVGLAAATPQGSSAMLVYLAIYIAMTVGSFVGILMMRDAEGNPVESITAMGGLSHSKPLLAWCMLLLMLSLAGIPPLFGFWGKLLVFQAAVNAGLVPLALLAILGSVISTFYYLKVCKVMFFDDATDVVQGRGDASQWVLLILCAAFNAPLGYLLTSWLGGLADKASAALFFVA